MYTSQVASAGKTSEVRYIIKGGNNKKSKKIKKNRKSSLLFRSSKPLTAGKNMVVSCKNISLETHTHTERERERDRGGGGQYVI